MSKYPQYLAMDGIGGHWVSIVRYPLRRRSVMVLNDFIWFDFGVWSVFPPFILKWRAARPKALEKLLTEDRFMWRHGNHVTITHLLTRDETTTDIKNWIAFYIKKLHIVFVSGVVMSSTSHKTVTWPQPRHRRIGIRVGEITALAFCPFWGGKLPDYQDPVFCICTIPT